MDKILKAEINELITNRLATFYCALTNAGEHSVAAGTFESTPAQLSPATPATEPPSHGRGLPQKTVPYPISRAMEFCFQNCRIAQRSEGSTGPGYSSRQKCRFPEDRSIDSVHCVDKR